MATLKADKAKDGAQPRSIHAGGVSVKAVYTITASLSAGDVIQMVKIPDNAVIDSVIVQAAFTGNSFLVEIGDSDDPNRFFASAALAGVNAAVTANLNRGYQYNLSDGAQPMHDTIDIVIGTKTSATATGAITAIVNYHMDEAEA